MNRMENIVRITVDKSKSMYIFKQILDLVDSSHSRGEPLLALRPPCFKLTPLNQLLYMGSPSIRSKTIGNLENGDTKRELEPNLSVGASQSSKRRKLAENGNSLCRWPKFAINSGFKDSGYGFNKENVSKMVSNFGGDALEEQWYASPEESSEKCPTLSSNVYTLGGLLFELLGSCESARAHAIAMMDLRRRILPPSYLTENPKEAGFCLWLLHPEPSLRPTTRDILQSELISEIQQSSVKQLSSTISHEDTESDLMLHFLASIKEQKQQRATKLVDDIKRLESGISEIESRWPNNTLTFPKPGFSSLNGSRLINNINQRVTESGQHEVLRSRKNNIVTKQHIKTMGPQ
ncbi:putative non-specific serine/threonine protein kinase [Helianthus annuus]|uniref:Protein kinase domain-containing protein n=1 Tax=Helianthus annuus TaxID=4232 RepID=A0A251RKT7_HELAN|nr:putative non-specific serine/threonine protein kinase [Helianthus annuus]KAJ0445892.1 putative non-specific serine/threonine protein kinase [Helianthus annuus]KAJ0630858.1 putative non-specific serine/threonine protein kinase [Helianthus annuus]KAJ0634716.1 putative non-specific serine/threonine protein kinase [Helianthus annuus]